MKTQESAYWRYHKLISYALAALAAVGGIVYFYLYFLYWPPGPGLGVAWSPLRLNFMAVQQVLVWIPLSVLIFHLYVGHQEWVAEDAGMPYEPGKHYPIWTTERIIRFAIAGAMAGIGGAVIPVGIFDLTTFTYLFVGVLYSPIETLGGTTLGTMFFREIMRGTWSPLRDLQLFGGGDTFQFCSVLMLYRYFIRPLPYKKRLMLVPVYAAIQIIVFGGYWHTAFASVVFPMPAGLVWSLTVWFQVLYSNLPGQFLAVLVATGLSKYVWKEKEYPMTYKQQ